ncbi:hypothetical protein [Stenotrophomonas sp.]|uniref:hypothetical protein n=1 Tax=Stenotrophomonas sp. TaxID=69392 RepID=UPI002FCB1193
MSWGHEALELDEDADERAVKRAYAKRLRVTRPDDDPVAFQQLHEAYQAALDWARYREQWQDDDEDEGEDHARADAGHAPLPPGAATDTTPAAPVPPAEAALGGGDPPPGMHDPVRTLHAADTAYPDTPARLPVAVPLAAGTVPAAPAPAAPLDPHAFAHLVVSQAQLCEPAALERWLQLRPELWSLHDKPLIGEAVLAQLLSSDVPVYIGNFDLLSQCFRWDEVGSGLDPYDADQCRLRLHRLWVLQPRNQAALGRYLHRDGVPLAPEKARTQLQRLTRPWAAWQALWTACWPDRVTEMRDTLARLDIHTPEDAPPPLQPRQVAFWLALADRQHLGGARLQVSLLRSALLAAAAMIVVPLLGVLVNLTPTRRSGGLIAPLGTDGFLKIGLYAAAAVLVLGAVLPVLRTVAGWQVAEEYPPPRWRRLNLWLIPILAITALLVIHLADARVAGSALAWLTLGIAVRRWWVRGGYVFKFNGWLLLAMWPFLKMIGLALMFGEIAVFGALLAWTVDAMTKVVHR